MAATTIADDLALAHPRRHPVGAVLHLVRHLRLLVAVAPRLVPHRRHPGVCADLRPDPRLPRRASADASSRTHPHRLHVIAVQAPWSRRLVTSVVSLARRLRIRRSVATCLVGQSALYRLPVAIAVGRRPGRYRDPLRARTSQATTACAMSRVLPHLPRKVTGDLDVEELVLLPLALRCRSVLALAGAAVGAGAEHSATVRKTCAFPWMLRPPRLLVLYLY